MKRLHARNLQQRENARRAAKTSFAVAAHQGRDNSTAELHDRSGGHFFIEDRLEHKLVNLFELRQRRRCQQIMHSARIIQSRFSDGTHPSSDMLEIYVVFLSETVDMRFAPEGTEPRLAFYSVEGGELRRFDNPACLAQQHLGVNGAGDRVQHAPLRRAEIAGDVAALFACAVDGERTDFLIRRNEVNIEIFADFGVGQGVRTERFSVVSGEARVFKVAGNVHDEKQLVIAPRQVGSRLPIVHK